MLHTFRRHGIIRRVWQHLHADLAWRQQGQKCVISRNQPLKPGALGRWKCEPWTNHNSANFSSLLPEHKNSQDFGAMGESNVAICVIGAPRTVVETFSSIRSSVVEQLSGDIFLHLQFPKFFSPAYETDLHQLGGIVTALLVPQNLKLLESGFQSELKHPSFYRRYASVGGPWKSPLYGQLGGSLWLSKHQDGCKRMVEAFEKQRGHQYEWIVFARADMLWNYKHPPLDVLDPHFVHIPWGQDNSYYNFSPLMGLNDRHAVVPRRWFHAFFNRYESILNGSAWRYLASVAKNGYDINSEQHLLLHLQFNEVPIRRFAVVSYLVACMQGPQCQHIYQTTELGDQHWTPRTLAKYPSELMEALRTSMDDVHYGYERLKTGWIWIATWPHTAWFWSSITKETQNEVPFFDPPPHLLLSADVACGLSRHGIISSLRWVFFRKCECHASSRWWPPKVLAPRHFSHKLPSLKLT